MRGSVTQRYHRLLGLGTSVQSSISVALARSPNGVARLVVLKGIGASGAKNPEAIQRLSFEARLSAWMNHPNVIAAQALCFDGRLPVIALEYLDGQSLATLLDAANGTAEFSLELRIGIVCRILRGLHYVHELRDVAGRRLWAIHAAVCPSHVMITYDGQVKLIDFGHALTRSSLSDQPFLGANYPYMAPEQVRGAPDRRVDVFSVGVLLWEMLAQTPLWGQTPAALVFRRLLTGAVPRLKDAQPECDPELDRICAKAMATHPGDRFATAAEMAEALERYLANKGSAVSDAAIGALVASVCREQRLDTKRALQARLAELRLPPSTGGAPRERGAPKSLPAFTHRPASLYAIVGGCVLVTAALLLGRLLGQDPPREREPTAAPSSVPAPKPTPATPSPAHAPAIGTQRPARAPTPAVSLVALDIAVSPNHATLYLDGQRLSSNPLVASMVKDDRVHTLRGEAPGFQPFIKKFSLELDQTIEATLEPARPGAIRRTARADRRLAEGRVTPRSPRLLRRAAMP